MFQRHPSMPCRVLLAGVIVLAAASFARADQVLWSQHAEHNHYYGEEDFGVRPISWLDGSTQILGTKLEVSAQAGHRTRPRLFGFNFDAFEGTVTGKASYDFSNNSTAGSLRSHVDLMDGLYTFDPFNVALRRDVGTGTSWERSREIWSYQDTIVIGFVPVTYSVTVRAGVEAYARDVRVIDCPLGVAGTVGVRPYLQGSALVGVGAGAWGFTAAAGFRLTLRVDIRAESPFRATLSCVDIPLNLTLSARLFLELGLYICWPDIDLYFYTIEGDCESWTITIVNWSHSFGPVRVARILY